MFYYKTIIIRCKFLCLAEMSVKTYILICRKTRSKRSLLHSSLFRGVLIVTDSRVKHLIPRNGFWHANIFFVLPGDNNFAVCMILNDA